MGPAQPSADIDPISEVQSSAADLVKTSVFVKSSGRSSTCISNSQDAIIEVENQCDEQIKAPKCDNGTKIAKTEDPDATEYSSSFDGTVSGTENYSGLSDAEIESCFYIDNGFTIDGFSSVFSTRKKLTTHWRSFIRPLMWRCKWAELKITEFQKQASKYARQLTAYDQTKQLGIDQFTLENIGSKPLPFPARSYGKKAMKRRKRKRVEDTTDLTSYMSKHILFSYHENKKFDPDGTSVAEEEFGNPEPNTPRHCESGIHNDCSFDESQDGNNDSLEEILWKIELVHSRVHKLKSQLIMVMAENCSRFSSSENLSLLMPCDGQTSSARSPTFSACNGDTASLGALYTSGQQHMPEYDFGDFVLPESMLSSYGEAISVPDIIESTVSLLSSADVTMYQSQIGDSCEGIMDNVQMHYQAAEVERHTSKKIPNQTMEKHQEPEGSGQEESSNPSMIPALEPDLIAITSPSHEQSRLKSSLALEIHFPKSKRKRGERKAGSGGWSR